MRMGSLVSANGATTSSTIHPGDVLCLPSGAASNPSASSAAGRPTGACPAARAAPDRRRPAGRAPRRTPPTYTVRDGDGWYLIASNAGVSMSSLLAANHATADSSLHPGREVCLPAGASAAIVAASTGSAGSFLPANAAGLDALPVQGPCWYGDTWHAARGEGRLHEGVDLLTAPGNYVYAVTDGTLSKRAWDQPGLRAGNAWWLHARRRQRHVLLLRPPVRVRAGAAGRLTRRGGRGHRVRRRDRQRGGAAPALRDPPARWRCGEPVPDREVARWVQEGCRLPTAERLDAGRRRAAHGLSGVVERERTRFTAGSAPPSRGPRRRTPRRCGG